MALLEKLTLGGSILCELWGCMVKRADYDEWKIEVGGQWNNGGKLVSCGVVIPELLGRHRDRSHRLTSGAVHDV